MLPPDPASPAKDFAMTRLLACVSAAAHDTPPGPDHGKAVSEVAKSDCGKATPEADANENEANEQQNENEAPEQETEHQGAAPSGTTATTSGGDHGGSDGGDHGNSGSGGHD